MVTFSKIAIATVQRMRVSIGENGRFVIPAHFRKAMGLKAGDEVILRLDAGELHLSKQSLAVSRLRQAIGKKDGMGVDDFLAGRKTDSGE